MLSVTDIRKWQVIPVDSLVIWAPSPPSHRKADFQIVFNINVWLAQFSFFKNNLIIASKNWFPCLQMFMNSVLFIFMGTMKIPVYPSKIYTHLLIPQDVKNTKKKKCKVLSKVIPTHQLPQRIFPNTSFQIQFIWKLFWHNCNWLKGSQTRHQLSGSNTHWWQPSL